MLGFGLFIVFDIRLSAFIFLANSLDFGNGVIIAILLFVVVELLVELLEKRRGSSA